MPRKPYLSHEKTRHGRFVWYFKRGGKRVRLPDPYGSPDFNAAYEAALSGLEIAPQPRKPKSGSLKWLVGKYKESAAFASLAPSTRTARDNILKQVLEDPRNAEGPFADITKAKIKAGLDKRAKTPNAANNFLKTMSHMFKWAVDAELLEVSPCVGVSKLKAKSDGFHTWTVDEVERYRAKHPLGTKPRLAIDLLLFLGLRRADVAIIGRQHIQNGVLSLRTGKNKTWVHLPIFKQLAASIDATPTGAMAFLTTEKGEPFKSAASFGNWFAKQCDAAKLPKVCRAHGLRKAGATIAADEGSTAHELMAMYGWSRLEMAQLYTREADKKKLARAASERLANKL